MTTREKMARAICTRNTGNDRSWALYLDDADAALSVLTNPDDETVERLAKALIKADTREGFSDILLKSDAYMDKARLITRAILAALKEEV